MCIYDITEVYMYNLYNLHAARIVKLSISFKMRGPIKSVAIFLFVIAYIYTCIYFINFH